MFNMFYVIQVCMHVYIIFFKYDTIKFVIPLLNVGTPSLTSLTVIITLVVTVAIGPKV